ncbi:hypothetical protein BDZ91DRAFT_791195 [Kalaharituber pfeilii]|nr:hypothetical protein BDZ91DRAFT_791195 [Kalaharituber pfeilii]
MIAPAIALDPGLQRANQFLILLPPGIEPRRILYSRTVSEGHETFSDNPSSGSHHQQEFARALPNMYICSQLPIQDSQFPGLDTLVTDVSISNTIFDNIHSAVPPPCITCPQVINDLIEYSLHESQESSEIFSSTMDHKDDLTHFHSQNAQSVLNAAAAASQQPQVMCWMSPNIPNDFVPAPSCPEYEIRFEEPTICGGSSPN